jgi:hypothetical protein
MGNAPPRTEAFSSTCTAAACSINWTRHLNTLLGRLSTQGFGSTTISSNIMLGYNRTENKHERNQQPKNIMWKLQNRRKKTTTVVKTDNWRIQTM